MRRRQQVGALRDQLYPLCERHSLQTVLGLRPLLQAAERLVFGLDEERRAFQIPVEHTQQIGVFTKTVVQHAVERHFALRSEEHTSELQSLMRISYAVFCLKKKQQQSTPQRRQ